MQQNLFTYQLSEIRVTYASNVKYADMRTIASAKDAEEIFRLIWSDGMEFREEFYMLILNRANKVSCWYRISEGGIAGTVVDPKIVFSVALKCRVGLLSYLTELYLILL